MKLRLDFLPLIERTVGTKGVLWDYIYYSTPALQRWVGARDPKRKVLARQFICRRDPRDLSHIYFWDPERKGYLDIPYRNPTRPRITLWEQQAARQFLLEQGRKEIDEDLLFEAREKRNRILLEAKHKTEEARRAKDRERARQAKEQAEQMQQDMGIKDAGKSGQEKRQDGLLDEADVPLFEDAEA
jgi:putative transposase